jgi:hypothetical protein
MNEFIIRSGFNVKNDVIITGSLNVYNITGSITSASYGITASYTFQAITASLVTTIPSSSYTTYAISSSYADVADRLNNYSLGTYEAVNITTSYAASSGDLGYTFSTVNSIASPGTFSIANRAAFLNSLVLSPIVAPITGTVTKMLVMGQSVGVGSTGSVRLGIYSNSRAMLPDTLILDAGSASLFPTVRMGYETDAIVGGPRLQQGEIYWLAMVTVNPGAGNTSYLTFNNSTLLNLFPFNRIFNPLLGVAYPSNDLSIRTLANYRYRLDNTASLPLTLPQTISSYTASAYGVIDPGAPSGVAGTIPIGPAVYIAA